MPKDKLLKIIINDNNNNKGDRKRFFKSIKGNQKKSL